ncbi:MAG TPA: hypothetical protein VE994_21580 [Terriglobales bacterium]|nr:hypothetical protein [Terriglobales bacterium]
MKRLSIVFALVFFAVSAWSLPIGTSARTAIPGQVQQIISVDYRALRDSPTAQALKAQVLPENLKQFEGALKGIGIDSEHDLEQLTFVSYRSPKGGLRTVGIAQGTFTQKAVVKKLRLKKIKPVPYNNVNTYPMGGAGMQMAFLDESTLAFGDTAALHGALDARNGDADGLDTNPQISDMIGAVEGGPVWSVLDQKGTQNMMMSALGDAAHLADYDVLKKRLLGSRYTMNFSNGVNFDLDVVTADSMTAATLSSLVKAGMMYKKMNASPVEKLAIDSCTVDNDSSNLKLHFKTDDNKFQALMHSELFAAVSK